MSVATTMRTLMLQGMTQFVAYSDLTASTSVKQ